MFHSPRREFCTTSRLSTRTETRRTIPTFWSARRTLSSTPGTRPRCPTQGNESLPGRAMSGQRHVGSGQRQVHILNGLVDLGGCLVAHRYAIDACGSERVTHGCLAVLTRSEGTFAHEFHADHAHSGLTDLADVRRDFAHVSQSVGVVVLRVHFYAFVIHADHRHLEPLILWKST